MADHTSLVWRVKEWQKQGHGHRNAWEAFVEKRGKWMKDPNRHEAEFLQEFLALADAGSLDLSNTAPPAFAGGGGGRPRQEGDWDCPSCGALVFANRSSCFRCGGGGGGGGAGGGGGRPRQDGDWDCPKCKTLVFAGRPSCVKCGFYWQEGSGASAGATAGGGEQAAPPMPAASIKVLAKLSPKLKQGWLAYCKAYGQGFADPTKYSDEYIGEFLEYAAGLLIEDMEKQAGKRSADGEEPPAKRKVSMKKSVADKISKLNAGGALVTPIKLAAVAPALSKLDEAAALDVLALLEEQQDEIDDPTEFLRGQVQVILDAEGVAA